MRAAKASPTGVERTFDEGRLIVSKTDRKGIISYANRMFLEVSALTEEQALGQPHNIIRHPEMPRSVFRLLWDRLAAGEEMFAYILNLALDGAHYWVFAHVTPSLDAHGHLVGYHSNRRSPQRSAVSMITPVYARLRAEERRHSRPTEALEASNALLHSMLDERGQSYDEFVWTVTDIPMSEDVAVR